MTLLPNIFFIVRSLLYGKLYSKLFNTLTFFESFVFLVMVFAGSLKIELFSYYDPIFRIAGSTLCHICTNIKH